MTKFDYDAIAQTIVDEHTTFSVYGKPGETRQSYDAVFFDQGFNETNEKILSEFISGETVSGEDNFPCWRESAYEALEEWVSDSISYDARELVDTYVKENDLADDEDFDEFELIDPVRFALHDATTQDYAREWVTGMSDPVIRLQVDGFGPDPSYMGENMDVKAEDVLAEAGIEATEKNVAAADTIIANAWHSLGYYNLFLVFRLDLDDVKDDSDTVRIVGEAELWMTNVYAGDGMADTVDVDMVVKRSDLSTDENAAGYSYNAVFCPHIPSIPQPEVEFRLKETAKS